MTAEVIPLFRAPPAGRCPRCGGHHDGFECAVQDAVSYLVTRITTRPGARTFRGALRTKFIAAYAVILGGQGFPIDVSREAVQRWIEMQ